MSSGLDFRRGQKLRSHRVWATEQRCEQIATKQRGPTKQLGPNKPSNNEVCLYTLKRTGGKVRHRTPVVRRCDITPSRRTTHGELPKSTHRSGNYGKSSATSFQTGSHAWATPSQHRASSLPCPNSNCFPSPSLHSLPKGKVFLKTPEPLSLRSSVPQVPRKQTLQTALNLCAG